MAPYNCGNIASGNSLLSEGTETIAQQCLILIIVALFEPSTGE